MELSGASLVFASPLWRETPGCNASMLTWTRIKKEVIKIGHRCGEVIEILTFPRNRQRPGTSVSIWDREADEYHTLKPGEENCPFSGLWFEIITWVGLYQPLKVAFLFFFFCKLISGFVGQQIVIYTYNCVFFLCCLPVSAHTKQACWLEWTHITDRVSLRAAVNADATDILNLKNMKKPQTVHLRTYILKF